MNAKLFIAFLGHRVKNAGCSEVEENTIRSERDI